MRERRGRQCGSTVLQKWTFPYTLSPSFSKHVVPTSAWVGRRAAGASHRCYTVTPAGRIGFTGGQSRSLPSLLPVFVLLTFGNSTWRHKQQQLEGKNSCKACNYGSISYWVILFLFFKDENIIKKVMGPELRVCSLQEVKPKDSYLCRLLMVLTLYLSQKSPELLWFCIVHGTFS